MAALALHHGINANVLRRWIREASIRSESDAAAGALSVPAVTARSEPAFIAVPVSTPASMSAEAAPLDAESERQIQLELQRADLTVSVRWPMSDSAHCAAWLRQVMR